ncbi:SGNH/GDSL hydrolase family protein [Clostridium algoriphilum]|uniref:SGNH/GDSL hydrolase family protein n=1 Tax=Clostridium algoriphilum TaxID=198347 RepID=UPI001CF1A686|nr:SGNH/GDSL hydrolase family protein [Clostridium algoriphilum]MCB2293546.1 SGNH/GDSL hydrolase family protein [Clostridium algoriphilum]
MKKILVTLSILLIMVAIYGIGVGVTREKNNEKRLTAIAQQHREEGQIEDEVASNMNVYEDLTQKQDINALVIGDSIGQSNGSSSDNAKWYNLIAKDVKTKYKSTITTDLITGGGTTGIRAWVELNNDKATKQYDVAYMCFGQKDQWSMTPEQFGIFYEGIIIKLKKTNPNIEIIPIIESSFREHNNYSKVIEELSKHYNLQVADTILTFIGASESYENLTTDVEIPNDKGYSYYAKTVEKVIDDNYKAKKKTNIKYNVLYKDTSKLNAFIFNKTPNLNNGFTINDEIVGDKLTSSLTFNTTNSLAIIHYLRQPNGGKFNVYLDGNLVKEIDTNSTYTASYSELISENLVGQHKIKIQVTSVNKGGTVKILGLATN